MNSRSKKYFSKTKDSDGEKKGSSTNAGYDEQNERNFKAPNRNPAPAKNHDNLNADAIEQKDSYGSLKKDKSDKS